MKRWVLGALCIAGCGGTEALESLPADSMMMMMEPPKDLCEGLILKLPPEPDFGTQVMLNLDPATGTCPEDGKPALAWGYYHSGSYIQTVGGWSMLEASQGEIFDPHVPLILDQPFEETWVRIEHDETKATYEVRYRWLGMIEILSVLKISA